MERHEMRTGTVKIWKDNAYGFIIPDDCGPDVFVHFRNIVGVEKRSELRRGDRVEFETGMNQRNGREEALLVRLLQDAAS
jgi:cold shock CspA family protein